eukprot:4030815-Pyramimonas_sp.AAC.1
MRCNLCCTAMWRNRCGESTRCNLHGALPAAQLILTDALTRPMLLQTSTPPTQPQLGLQHPRSGDSDACSALAGASLRPRQPLQARATAR